MASSETTIYSRFSKVVEKFAEKVAIDDDHIQLTYRELAFLSNQISAAIEQSCNYQNQVIGILSDNHINAIASMIGIAQTSHAFVILSPQDPDERIKFVLNDCNPALILVDKTLIARARQIASHHMILCLDEILNQSLVYIPSTPVCPSNLFYIVYTSGSTGQPKGVAQTQRNLLFYVDAYSNKLQISHLDHLSMVYSLSFSASNLDIFSTLLNGATLFTYPMRQKGILNLAEWIIRKNISVLHCVPTVLRELTRSISIPMTFQSLRVIDLGGETLLTDDIFRFKKYLQPNTLFINHLAATEISVIAQLEVAFGENSFSGIIPVGESPANVKVSVIRNKIGTPADVNEVGLIVIESPYLSPGYYQRPDLNRLAFSIVKGQDGWRRYISGDMGKIDENGNLHFIGRSTSRIKLRGQSIDLSEVESSILSCNHISEVVVVPHNGDSAETEALIAFVVMNNSGEGDPRLLRQELAKKLPLYMIPSGYVFMDSFPHTVTGKVDRLALSNINIQQVAYRADYVEPETDQERQIAQIFSNILQFIPVGRLDDFFLIGGDSVNMVQLHAALKKQFNIHIPHLHEDATPIGISRKVDVIRSEENRMPRLIPLRTHGDKAPLFLVHGRYGQAFVSPSFVEALGEGQPLYAIQAKGLDGHEAPHSSIREMAEDYVKHIQLQQEQGPYFIGALCAGAYVALEMARILQSQNKQVLPLLLFDPTPKFAKVNKKLPSADEILAKLEKSVAKGSIKDLSPQLIEPSVQVAQSFESALRRYQYKTYKGSVYLLASGQRLQQGEWSASKLYHLFGNRIECYQVSEKHFDVLNPSNLEFKNVLKDCLNKIHLGITPINNLATLNINYDKSYTSIHYWWWRLRRFCRL
jgi:amino acid adenylation domain-containing protein